MAENIDILSDGILEKSTAKVTTTVLDEDGVAIPGTSLDTLILTFFNIDDSNNTVINSRDGQNVLNANNVTVDSSGNLIWLMQVLDNIIVASTGKTERHRAVFEWTYSSGTKTGKHIVEVSVINLVKTS